MILPCRYTTTSWQLGRVNGRGTSVSARIMVVDRGLCCWCSLVFPQPSDSSAIVVMIETCVKAALLPNHVFSTRQLEGPRLVQRFYLKRGWSSQRKVERDLKADVRTADHECKMAFPESMSKL